MVHTALCLAALLALSTGTSIVNGGSILSVAYGVPFDRRDGLPLCGMSSGGGIGTWTEAGTSGSAGAFGISTLSNRGPVMSLRFATTRQENVPSPAAVVAFTRNPALVLSQANRSEGPSFAVKKT